MGERVCGFPGKILRSLFLGLEGYNRSLFGLLMGCGGTIVEGGRLVWGVCFGPWRLRSFHIYISNKQALFVRIPHAVTTALSFMAAVGMFKSFKINADVVPF